jgi:hypothetical protein
MSVAASFEWHAEILEQALTVDLLNRIYHSRWSSSLSHRAEKFSTVPTQHCCVSMIAQIVMLSIMRRCNGLMASSVSHGDVLSEGCERLISRQDAPSRYRGIRVAAASPTARAV